MKDLVAPKQKCTFRIGLDAKNMGGWGRGRKDDVLSSALGITGWGQYEGSVLNCTADGSLDCVTCLQRRGRFNGCLTRAWNITGQFVVLPDKIRTGGHHECLILVSVEIQKRYELWV